MSFSILDRQKAVMRLISKVKIDEASAILTEETNECDDFRNA